MEMYSISSKLKNLRENRNMAQNEVAEYLGTSQQNYSRYENGRRDLPIRYLEPLTNLYHVSADYLLGLSITPKDFSIVSGIITDKEQLQKIENKIASFKPENLALLLDYIEDLYYKQNKTME